MRRDLLRFAFPDLAEKTEIVTVVALRERENGRRLDHHKGLGACDRAAKTAAVKRPISTDDQVQLNGELKIQGRSLTFVRCFLVSDRSGIATLPELLVASFASTE